MSLCFFLYLSHLTCQKKFSPSTGLLWPATRNLQVHKELRHFMRPHSTTLCGRCRFLSAPLWDKQSQGAGRLPRVPLPAALHIVSRNPTTKNDIEFFLLANEYFEDYAKLPPKLPHYCPAGSSSWKNLILSAAGSYSITARHFFSGNRKLTSQGSRASNSV